MAKHIFKSVELNLLTKPYIVDTPRLEIASDADEEAKEEELQPTGPTVDEVESEIAQIRVEFEKELEERRIAALSDANQVKKDAENWAFNKVKEAGEEYDRIIAEAQANAEDIKNQAQDQANKIQKEASDQAQSYYREQQNKGFEEGREDGFNSGKEEVDRLISRLHVIIESAIRKRNQVLEEAESQVSDIIITIAKKVVKSITEVQKDVVRQNVMEALTKLKGRAEVTIRVNVADLQMTAKHQAEFISALSGIDSVRILEDVSVERGGCIISTDFGSVDARISSQLLEIEKKIKEISPYREIS